MRQRRLKAPANSYSHTAYYHCISRVVNRDFVLGDDEREEFVRLMRLYERLCGLRVVTYCVMSNHFHLLVGVPKRPEVMPSNAELIDLVHGSLGELAAASLRDDLEQAAKIKSTQWEEEIRERYLRRMWDISAFMKTLKQRFTQWFNRKHKRKGTLCKIKGLSLCIPGADSYMRTLQPDGTEIVVATSIDRAHALRTVTQTVTRPGGTPIVSTQLYLNGLLMAETQPGLAGSITHAYDGLERRIATTDPRTGTVQWDYLPDGRLNWTKDAGNRQTTYTYYPTTGPNVGPSAGLLHIITHPDTTTTVHEYDVHGRLTLQSGALNKGSVPL